MQQARGVTVASDTMSLEWKGESSTSELAEESAASEAQVSV